MEPDNQEYTISYELTEIFRRTRAEMPEETAKKMDAIWARLEKAVSEINRIAKERAAGGPYETDPKEVLRLAEGATFSMLNELLREELYMAHHEEASEEERREFLEQELKHCRDLNKSEAFKTAVKECSDDELLYRIALRAPKGIYYSFGDLAVSRIKSEEYRYAAASSSIEGRRTLIHDLAVSRELDEMLAARILLTDTYVESKRESMYVIKSEALLMLAFLKSYSYRGTATDRLKELGSDYPDRYIKMSREEREETLKGWFAEACGYAKRIIQKDGEMREKLGEGVDIDSALLIGFIAACDPDLKAGAEYAEMITSEVIAAYVGKVTDNPYVRRILAPKVRNKKLLDYLPYKGSAELPFPVRENDENRYAFCMEVLKAADEDSRSFLMERMEDAGIPAHKEAL